MDELTAFVELAHIKLRLELIERALSKLVPPEPYMPLPTPPKLPAPMEFAGLKARLQRAKGLEKRAGVAGPALDAALDVIEHGVTAMETHVPELQKYGKDLMDTINGMLEGSNGGPPLDDTTVNPTQPAPGPNGGPRIL